MNASPFDSYSSFVRFSVFLGPLQSCGTFSCLWPWGALWESNRPIFIHPQLSHHRVVWPWPSHFLIHKLPMQTLAKIARKVLTPKFFDLRIHTIVHNMIDNDISCRSKSLTKLFFPLDGLPWILSARPHWVNNPHKSFSRSFKRLLLPMSFFLWNESFGQFCKTGTNSDLAYPISCIRICLCISPMH